MSMCSKSIFLSFAVAIFSFIAFGQEKPELQKGEFAGLLRAGLVTSQIHNDDIGGYNKLGGTLGTGIFTPLANDLHLQIEINYSMRGSRKRPGRLDRTTFFIEPHYIDVPIIFRKFIWKFDFEAGITNGIFLFSRINDPNFLLPNTVSEFNRYELAGNLGVHVPINEKWTTNVRLHYSLLPASGSLQFVNGLSLLGGAYNNALTFAIYRSFYPKD